MSKIDLQSIDLREALELRRWSLEYVTNTLIPPMHEARFDTDADIKKRYNTIMMLASLVYGFLATNASAFIMNGDLDKTTIFSTPEELDRFFKVYQSIYGMGENVIDDTEDNSH